MNYTAFTGARFSTRAAIRRSKSEVDARRRPMGRAAVPSGASTGEREALELRDGVKKRYLGKGVRPSGTSTARSPPRWRAGSRQRAIDARITLDGTPNKARLGANAILGVSMAVARAVAAAAGVPLYTHLAASTPAGRAPGAAGADDEHPERRRARGQQRRLPGVHGDARSASRRSRRRCGRARRSSMRCAAS